jgi:mono/diheme cytochrome c family protein
MKRAFVIILGGAALLLAPGSALAQDAKATKAIDIFVKQKCTTCHSIAGRGSKKGPLDDVGSKLTPAQIREWLVDPVAMAAKTQPPPTRKPPMKKKPLAPEDIDALVAYLATLKG